MKRSWDILSDEVKRDSIRNLIAFFETERDEQIGEIAAEAILDSILIEIAPKIYNQAIRDTQNIVKEKLEYLELDIESLSK